MRRDTAGIREATEELLQTSFVIGNEGIRLAIRAIKQRLSSASRSAVTGAHKKDSVLIVIVDKAVDMAKQEIQAGCGSPVPHQPVLNVFPVEAFLHKRVAAQVNLTDRKIVCRSPILVDTGKLFLGNRLIEPLPRRTDNRLSHCSSFIWPHHTTQRFFYMFLLV